MRRQFRRMGIAATVLGALAAFSVTTGGSSAGLEPMGRAAHPDCGQVIFFDRVDGDSSDIFAVGVRSKRLYRVTSDPNTDRNGVLSPNGRRLVFSSWRSGNEELYLKTLATGNVRRLTWNVGSDDNASWS